MMPGIRRFEPKTYGVVCDTCDFPAEVTQIGAHRSEHPADRSRHCTHPNAQDDYFIADCPNWLRSVKNGRRLDADGNLMER